LALLVKTPSARETEQNFGNLNGQELIGVVNSCLPENYESKGGCDFGEAQPSFAERLSGDVAINCKTFSITGQGSQ
jgi:hypothetical protein